MKIAHTSLEPDFFPVGVKTLHLNIEKPLDNPPKTRMRMCWRHDYSVQVLNPVPAEHSPSLSFPGLLLFGSVSPHLRSYVQSRIQLSGTFGLLGSLFLEISICL